MIDPSGELDGYPELDVSLTVKVVSLGIDVYFVTVTRLTHSRRHLFIGHSSMESMIFALIRHPHFVQEPSEKNSQAVQP